jgi:hypothetical protein
MQGVPNFPGIYSNDEVDGSNREDILVDQNNGISGGRLVRNGTRASESAGGAWCSPFTDLGCC